ncbi:IclR family transcriptional regulator [Pseudonocardia spinosispora]|uniref:IclR family transcriptional regulator n=1 Tax=Pseudonocardia spinosispora TaxID=103441 RepID=UPI00040444CB|nr:IclR family transcriptional regulator [Pseudonocardia spinosispora]
MTQADGGETVLSRATRVLEAFRPGTPSLTASDISRRTGIPMASTHRLVAEMVRLGLLEKGPDRLLRVGVRLWELGWRSTSALGLRDLAMPYLEDLQSVVRQHTQLALLEGTDVLYIERLSARGQTTVNITRVAGRLPAHTCSSGLVLLAFGSQDLQERVLTSELHRFTSRTVVDPAELRRRFADTRRRDSATLAGSVHLDAAGVAAPIRNRDRTVVAALSVIVPNSPDTVSSALPAVMATARGITRALHHHPDATR